MVSERDIQSRVNLLEALHPDSVTALSRGPPASRGTVSHSTPSTGAGGVWGGGAAAELAIYPAAI